MPTSQRAEALTVVGSNGRRLDVRVSGERGPVFLLHHGTAGANTQYEPFVRAALERGLRLVTYSRPGYGHSDRAIGRTVADAAGDVARVLDAVGAETCVTIGPSGGGPHALATAALLPERTLACATVGGLAPYGAADLDWFADMGASLVTTYGMAAAGDDAGLERWITAYRERLGAADPPLFDAENMPLAQVDLLTLARGFGTYLLEDVREALREGPWGWFDDAKAFTSPWSFDVSAIRVPVTVWQGAQDRMVPPAHGRWLADHIPGARLEMRPEHGHMSLADSGFQDVLDAALP